MLHYKVVQVSKHVTSQEFARENLHCDNADTLVASDMQQRFNPDTQEVALVNGDKKGKGKARQV